MIAGWVLSGSWPSAWVTHPSREPHLSSVRFSNSFRFFSLRNSFGDSLFSQNIKSPVLLCWEFGSIFLLLEGFFLAPAFRLTRPHPKSWPDSCTRQETGYCWFPVFKYCVLLWRHPLTLLQSCDIECRLHWFLCVLKLEKVFNKTC